MNRSFYVYLCLLFSVFSLTAMESEKRRGVDPNEIRKMFFKRVKKPSDLKNIQVTTPDGGSLTVWNHRRLYKRPSPVDKNNAQSFKEKKKIDYCPAILLGLGLSFTGLQLLTFVDLVVGGIKKFS